MYTLSFDKSKYTGKLIFYPHQITQWCVEFKALPFTKMSKEKVDLITNLYKRETSTFNSKEFDIYKLSNSPNSVLNQNITSNEVMNTARQFLKDTYLHKRKVWSYPVITFLNTYTLYVPYLIIEEYHNNKLTKFLVEPLSGKKDFLHKYREISNYYESEVI